MEELITFTDTLNEVTLKLNGKGLDTSLNVKGILKEAGEEIENIDSNYSYTFKIAIFRTRNNFLKSEV